MKSGDLVTAEFQGAVSLKRRPAVVVSTEKYHHARPDVILAVVTSQIEKAVAETDCILQDWKIAGLNKPSAVRIFLLTLPKDKIKKIGELSQRDWSEVQKRLQVSLEV